MHPARTFGLRALLFLLFAALLPAGCKIRSNFSGTTDLKVNNQRTITQTRNGVVRKIQTTTDVVFKDGKVTQFPSGAVVRIAETGVPVPREAELRENGGVLELWIKDKGTFRRGSPEDDAWLERILGEVAPK